MVRPIDLTHPHSLTAFLWDRLPINSIIQVVIPQPLCRKNLTFANKAFSKVHARVIILEECRVLIKNTIAFMTVRKSFRIWNCWYEWRCFLLSILIPQNVFLAFDNVFHVYLMRGFPKYARNSILTMAFWGQTKTGQKIATRWAGLAVLSCRYSSNSHRENSISYIFLQSHHQVEMKNIVKCYKDFFGVVQYSRCRCTNFFNSQTILMIYRDVYFDTKRTAKRQFDRLFDVELRIFQDFNFAP